MRSSVRDPSVALSAGDAGGADVPDVLPVGQLRSSGGGSCAFRAIDGAGFDGRVVARGAGSARLAEVPAAGGSDTGSGAGVARFVVSPTTASVS
jgi:hypothetical protein